ncbi:hypothetical protein [Thermogutta sp.]|uniref:hypothetical protein n=1 Tax=Thermogutta sp. TaxID=1962930 RepID=UPI003C7DF19F
MGAGLTGLLVAAYRGLGCSQPLWISQPLPAFGLEGPGNLASWVSTLVLTWTAVASLLIWWTLHASETPRGGSWLLAAVWWFYLGLDESAGIHLTVGPILHELFGVNNPASPWWWVVPYCFVFCALLTRLTMDLRYSGWASFWMTLAVALYGCSGLIQTGLIPDNAVPVEGVIAEEVGELLGHWCLLLAVLSFGRDTLCRILEECNDVDQISDSIDEAPRDESPEAAVSVAPSRQSLPGADNRTPSDYLIIHPPHGQGPPVAVPREVKRVTRRRARTTSSCSGRRSDLDLPRPLAGPLPRSSPSSRTSPAEVSPSPPTQFQSGDASDPRAAMPSTISPGSTNGPMNAFLAGMAYAEARQAGVVTPSPTGSTLPNTTATVAQKRPGQVDARAISASGPLGGGAPSVSSPIMGKAAHQTYSQPIDPASSSGSGTSTSPTSQGMTGQSGSRETSGTSTSVPQLPARRLTKEEKKRLKQLYKQKMAQIEGD